jgi:hypothetical protein
MLTAAALYFFVVKDPITMEALELADPVLSPHLIEKGSSV